MRTLTRVLLVLAAASATATATANPIDSMALKPSCALSQFDQMAGISVPFPEPIWGPMPGFRAEMNDVWHEPLDHIELVGSPQSDLICWWGGWLIWTGGW